MAKQLVLILEIWKPSSNFKHSKMSKSLEQVNKSTFSVNCVVSNRFF